MTEPRHLRLHYPVTKYSPLREWRKYANWLQRHVKVSVGMSPEPVKTPLKAKVFGKWEGNGYTCEKVYFESLPGFLVTGNLFRSTSATQGKCPGILCPHGHWPDGRLHDRDPSGSVVARCIQFARLGATVFSYDMVGYNDSCQLEHHKPLPDVHFGMSNMGLHTWNSVRSVDFMLSLPEVDAKRIGVTGTSGGGTQTFMLCAVDPRIAAAAPICMISQHMQGGCICENAPLLRIDATSVDIARLFAPKPLFMGSCTTDWTKNTPTEEYPAVSNIFGLYGASDQLLQLQVDDVHNYNQEMREHVYGFFNRFLFNAESADPIPEYKAPRPPHRDRMLWWGKSAPKALSKLEFQNIWREHIGRALRPHLKSADLVRKGLGKLLPHALGVTRQSVAEFRSMKPVSIAVETSDGSLKIAPVRAPKRYGTKEIMYFEAYNRTPFADRVHEILAAIDSQRGSVKLLGSTAAGPATLVAAALSKKVTSVEADMRGFDPDKDSDWKKHMHTPCIRQVGGLATVFALLGKRPVKLTNTSETVDALLQKYAR